MQAQLTIVVPVRNRISRLTQTLESIAAAANHRSVDLILVDNGSTDGSLEACQAFASAHREELNHISVLSELRPGASTARNTGLAACTTEWIYFFDSDDLMSEYFCDVLCRELAARGNDLDILAFPVRMIVEGQPRVKDYETSARPDVHILNSMMCTEAMAMRTSWLREQGGWNETLTTWDDWELGARLLMAHPRLQWYTQQAFHQIITHEESQTGASFMTTLSPIIKAMTAVMDDIRETTNLTDKERCSCLQALYARARIIAGKLAHEGSPEGHEAFCRIANKCLPEVSRLMRMTGWGLEAYTSMGGRGAWRLARRLI